MTPPRTIIAGILDTAWFRSPLKRRLTFAAGALILGILCLYPETYVAEAQLQPRDSGGGLSAVLAGQASGMLLDLGALTGTKQSTEADLTIARSHVVLDRAIDRLHLIGQRGFKDRKQAEAKLEHKLGIVAIRGSILQITAHDHDPAFAKSLVGATAEAIQDRLADISMEQSAQKRSVATNRLADATIRLAQTQEALNQFRVANKLPAPEVQLGSGLSIMAGLQGRLQAKQVELASLQQVATGENIQVKLVRAEIAGLQRQIADAKGASTGRGDFNLPNMASASTRYYDLYRDEKATEILYEVYTRYLDELTIDDLSARQNMDLIEPAYVDPSRQFNIWAVALLALLIMIAVGAEYYAVTETRVSQQ